MSDRPDSSEREPTDVRFSIRGILIATVPVAILATIVGAIFRRMNALEQTRMAVLGMGWLLAVAAWVGYQARRRYLLERVAGHKLFELATLSKLFPRVHWHAAIWRGFGRAAMGLLFLSVCIAPLVVLPSRQGSTPGYFWLIYLVASVVLAAQGIVTIWWRDSMQLRTNGALQGAQFIDWDQVVRISWSDDKRPILTIEGIEHRGSDAIFQAVATGPEQKSAVDRLLQEKVGSATSIPDVAGRRDRSPTITPVLKTRISFSTPLADYIRTFLYVALFGYLLIALANVHLDVPATIVGIACCWLYFHWLANRMRGAGKLLARLSARRSWGEIALSILLLVALHWFAAWFSWQVAWAPYFSGFAFGGAWYWALKCVTLAYLDLNSNGATHQGQFYWPWPTVRLITWAPSRTGRLVLGRRFQRVVAYVPPEQREAVDGILREKMIPLGTKSA